MRLLVTGACGFAGSTFIRAWLESAPGDTVYGMDNLSRPGSETNRASLGRRGVSLFHGDVRMRADFDALPPADWVIDAAANPSVLAGAGGRLGSRQVAENNLLGTVNTLEYCRTHGAGLILLSTSRVYSIEGLTGVPLEVRGGRFALASGGDLPPGISRKGVSEAFSTAPPVSLYGSTKLASEVLALEYSSAFGLPVFVNRCGVMAGAGQFGRPEQGIFSYWINSWLRGRPLCYRGFGGRGLQVRDCLHPGDLVPLVRRQAQNPGPPRVVNVGGGRENSVSLAELSAWCRARFGEREVSRQESTHGFDVPWLVMDCSLASVRFGWSPVTPLKAILEEIAVHAEEHPGWLEISGCGP